MSKLTEIRDRVIDALDVASKRPEGLTPDEVHTLVQLLKLEGPGGNVQAQRALTPEEVELMLASLKRQGDAK